MNCRDYHNDWNTRLDQVGRGLEEEFLADSLLHESRCDECRRLGAGYRALGRLLPLSPPSVPRIEGLADRVLNQLATTRQPHSRLSIASLRLPLSIAAALVLCVTAGLLFPRGGAVPPERVVAKSAVARPRPSLTLALSEASKATLALARETSGPAARVGNDFLGGARREDASPRLTFSMPLDVAATVDTSSEALINVGRRVNDGVRPLSATARSAFGFLLRTSREVPQKVVRPSSGA